MFSMLVLCSSLSFCDARIVFGVVVFYSFSHTQTHKHKQVIPRVCYPHLLRAQRMRSTRRKLAVMTAVLNDTLLVPPPHRRCYFSAQISSFDLKTRGENKMSANNLAICFAPTLLRPPSSTCTHRSNSKVSSNLLNDLCTTVTHSRL